MDKYLLITMSYHHNSEKDTVKRVFHTEGRMNSDILEQVVAEIAIWGASDYFGCNVDDENFHKFVFDNFKDLYMWLLGDGDIDMVLEQEGEDNSDWSIFNLEDKWDKTKTRNIGLTVPGGSKYDTVWIRIDYIDHQLEQTRKEIRTLPIDDVVNELALKRMVQ